MRDEYCSLLDQIPMYKSVGDTSSLERRCWEIRKDAYRILAKLQDDGQDIGATAAVFGWSAGQLANDVLRDWLCKSPQTPPDLLIKQACEVITGKCQH